MRKIHQHNILIISEINMTYLDTLEINIRQSASAKLAFLEDGVQLDIFNNAVTAIAGLDRGSTISVNIVH